MRRTKFNEILDAEEIERAIKFYLKECDERLKEGNGYVLSSVMVEYNTSTKEVEAAVSIMASTIEDDISNDPDFSMDIGGKSHVDVDSLLGISEEDDDLGGFSI